MDPISAAGIGLAVVGLTGQCFTGAMRALELITTARNLKPEYKFLTIRLQLEKQRCLNWASESGLLAYFENERNPDALSGNLTGLNRGAILEVVIQIEILVVDFIKYKGRYGNLVPDADTAEPSRPLGVRAIEENKDDELSTETHQDVGSFLAKAQGVFTSANLPKRIRWAAMDRGKYETLINKLKALNDSLLDLMDDRLRTAIYQSTRETRLSVLQLNRKVEDLCQLIKALSPPMANAPFRTSFQGGSQHPLGMIEFSRAGASTEFLDQLRGSDDRQLIELARFKVVNASIEDQQSLDESIANDLSITQPSQQIHDTTLKRANIRVTELIEANNTSNRTEAEYKLAGQPPLRVWIEWKEYTPIDRQLNPSPAILDRVQKLTALLRDPNKPASLHVPSCIGYFDDAEQRNSKSKLHSPNDDEESERPPECRFGFVFLQPAGSTVTATTSMQSLWDILGSPAKPSLTKRIALARALSSSVHSLHLVNWLHKGLRSANILFSKEAVSPVDISSPYISGFDYARPAQKGEMTEMPALRPEHNFYRHPDAHATDPVESQGFRKTFDIYSLGIILVEIACWQRIDVMLNIENPKRINPRAIKQRLLDESASMEAVEGGAGTRFAMATKACLEGPTAFGLDGDDDETEDEIGAKLSNGFYEKVLRCLENIST